MEENLINPFEELPEALVEEMLNQCDGLGNDLSNSFKEIYLKKTDIRKKLKELNLLRRDTELSVAPSHPTSCGVDGSYAIEKLLCTDMIAMAGVAVEGLTPPKENRIWERPHHFSGVMTIRHNADSTNVVRAIGMSMELQLVGRAPHDTIFFDGSLTIPAIYLHQAFNSLKDMPDKLIKLFKEGKNEFKGIRKTFEYYKEILTSPRTDKIFAGFPKYSTKGEIAEMLGMNGFEDRSLLTFSLDAGEFVGPIDMKQPEQEWHFYNYPNEIKDSIPHIIDGLKNIKIIYYRPYEHFPTLRIEVSQSIASNLQRLAILFESIKLQCGAPGIMEPYPLYLADRMVKHLGTALPAIRRTTTQEMSLKWEESLGNMYLAMHGYRTEQGR